MIFSAPIVGGEAMTPQEYMNAELKRISAEKNRLKSQIQRHNDRNKKIDMAKGLLGKAKSRGITLESIVRGFFVEES